MKLSYTVSGKPEGDPIEIEISGTNRKGEPIPPLSVQCYDEIPDVRFVEIMGGLERARISGQGFMVATADAVNFVEQCVIDEDRKRFHNFVRNPEVIVRSELLQTIFNDLTEVYANRPTERSSSSSSGPSNTAPTLTAESSSGSSQPQEPSISNGSATLSTV